MTSTIGEILPTAARRFGDRTALLVGERAFSFDDLEALSNRVANCLVADGVQPGDRVALYGPNCWEWLVAYYGVAKTGAVVIPVNVMLTPDEVRYVVENSGASAVVASPDKRESLLDSEGPSCCGAMTRSTGSPEVPRSSRPCIATPATSRPSVTRRGRRAIRRARCSRTAR